MRQLTNIEIRGRLVRLNNVERLYEEQKAQLQKARAQVKTLKEENEVLEEQVKELTDKNQTLSLRVDELATMVFGKKRKHDESRTYSARVVRTTASYHRPIPREDAITSTKHHPIDCCSTCSTTLTNKHVVTYYVEDIELPKKIVIRHDVESGWCAQCRRVRRARDLPTAKVIVGETVQTTVSYLSTVMRLSYAQIQDDLRNRFNLHLSLGELIKIQYRNAEKHRLHFEHLKDLIRSFPVVHMDETGDRVRDGDGFAAYTWGMFGTGPEVVYLMGQTRGKGVAEKLLGDSRATGVSDNCAVYSNLFARHQLCWAHPHRKFRDLANAPGLDTAALGACVTTFTEESVLYARVRMLANRHDLTQRQRTYWYITLKKKLVTLSIVRAHDPKKLRTYKETLVKTIEAYLTCVRFPDIPCDNNLAERRLRPVVLKRTTSFGHITARGADMASILMSVFMTIRNHIQGTNQTFFEAYAAFAV